MYKHLLVPVDGSELSMRAVESSVALAKALGARLSGFVCEAALPMPTIGVQPSAYERQADDALARGDAHASKILSDFEAAARAQGVPFHGHYTRSDKTDQAIVDAAQSLGCDMIIMVTHGRGVFGELLFGSHTKAVMGLCRLPVLVLQ